MARYVCPWWLGYLLASPLRRALQNPETILAPYLAEGQTVLDVGCGMGFFSLPMARLTGPAGRVYAVDLQERMLRSLIRRASRAGLSARIETRLCGAGGLGIEDLAGRIDFALAFAVVHEVPDPAMLLAQIRQALKPGGRLLIAEPTGHVKDGPFEATVRLAVQAGLAEIERPRIPRSHAVLLRPETGVSNGNATG